MEKDGTMKKCDVWYEKCFCVVANFNDFKGDVSKWKMAWYELWRFQMTFSMAYQMYLVDGRNGVFVSIHVKEAYLDNLKASMDDLGYRNIKTSEELVGLVDDVTDDCFVYDCAF